MKPCDDDGNGGGGGDDQEAGNPACAQCVLSSGRVHSSTLEQHQAFLSNTLLSTSAYKGFLVAAAALFQ